MAIARHKWGARGTVPIDNSPKRELYIHHTVTSGRKRNASQERAHMRELENMHIGQGWNTIGYSFVLFPSGRLYEGRGGRGYPAAQAGHNAGTLSISCVGDYRSQKLSRRQRLRLHTAVRSMKRNHSQLRAIGGHRDAPGQSTSCPGGNIESWLNGFAKKVGLRRL